MAGMTPDQKKRLVQKAVREAIKEADGGDVTVTQATSLGPQGLGHLCPLRQQYLAKINARLAPDCRAVGIGGSAFCDASVQFVSDVTDIVLKKLKCTGDA